jgi:hypothetical protein
MVGIVTKIAIAKKTGKALRRAANEAVKELGGKKKAKKAGRAAAVAAVDELTAGLVDLGASKSKKKKQKKKSAAKKAKAKGAKKSKKR